MAERREVVRVEEMRDVMKQVIRIPKSTQTVTTRRAKGVMMVFSLFTTPFIKVLEENHCNKMKRRERMDSVHLIREQEGAVKIKTLPCHP